MKNLLPKSIKIYSFLCLLLLSKSLHAQNHTQTYSSTSTYTVPAGVTSIIVEAWGGGGRGSTVSTILTGGGGGGGGAYAKKVMTVTPGTTYTVTVGAGSTTTAAGGDSWFSNTTTVLAKGGSSAADNSATGAAGGSNSTSIGDTTKAGGKGANGVAGTYGGGGGSSAGNASNGTDATNATGAVAPTGGGNGGNGKSLPEGNGSVGVTIGGGGGGALRVSTGTRTGGAGATGQIKVSWDEPEIVILGNSTIIVDGDATPSTTDWTDFGSVNVTSGTVVKTFSIQNTGTATLTLGAITIGGAAASDFTVTTAPPATLGTGLSTTFSITFDPSAGGTRSAIFSIVNGDTDENPYNFSIQGTGLTPEMDVTGNSISIADGDATPSTTDWTDFGSTDINTGTVTQTFTIENTGTAPLILGAVTIGGTNAADFTYTLPTTPVAIGSNTTFTVTFNPSAVGIRTATFSIVTNDTDENPYNFSIQGTGTEQEMDIQGNAVSIVDGDTTPSTTDWTDFGSVTSTRTFTILNTGTSPLTIGAISFSGTNPTDFSVTTAPSATVAAGSSTTFVVSFSPGAAGVRSATMSIVNNDSSENPYDFKIQGTGVSPSMNIKGNNVSITDGTTATSTADWTDFGVVNISSSVTRVFTIENTGTMNLNLTGTPKVAISGSSEFTIFVQPSSPVMGVSTTTFTVKFSPLTTGNKTADISIANNDAGAGKNPYTFRVTASGIQAYLDSDGDGVYNNADSDDDNDGIPDYIEQSNAASSVLATQVTMTLLNETFGTGVTRTRINSNIPTASTTYCYEDGTTAQAADECDTNLDLNDGQYTISPIAGTTAIASWAPSYWYQGPDHTPSDTNGRMALFNATNDITDEFYSTAVQGIIANAPLTYSFYVLNLDRSDAPSIGTRNRPNITVEFRDSSNNLISTINTGNIAPTNAASANGDWYQFSATFTPTITGFTITFKNNQPGGIGNDLAIDDILITQQLADTDRDGVADVYDLDSDNDGIGGIIEDGWASLSNGRDSMDRTTPGVWLDANNNGWHDTVEAWYATHTNASNFDGDLVPNYIDLDSDNDGKFDVDEAGLYNGDGDVNGDGVGEGTDTDTDGILLSFDALSGYGNTGKANPTNTLGTGNADYIKVASQTAGVYDISTTLYASLDANNNGVIDGTTDIDRDGILDAFDTNTAYYGSPRDLNRKLLLDFDGRNDYAENTAILGGLANASLMAWIDLNSAYTTDGIVVGQDKFKIRITSAKKLEAEVNGTTVAYSTTLNTSQWYHVAATYNSSTLKLYLNGNLVNSQAISGSIAADATKLTLGRNPAGTDKYFKGKIDEVRVFNVALSDTQLQRMVYQEIQNTSSQVRGTIIPKDVGTLPYANLLRYYRMDAYKDDIVDDLTTASIDTGTGMKMYNHKNIYVQQAPMPFITEQTGSFATAVNSPTKDIRGLDIMDQDWSIVQVKHNITETANNVDLGMFVDPGVTIKMTNDTKIQNDWYLKLDGKIDLVGQSQLVQTVNSDLDVTSAGSLERDQQGQSNKYNYNYWSSPVSSINATTINHGFTVAGVMKDGTDPNNIQAINWTSNYDSAATSPITLSDYWIYKFQNVANNYANWSSVGPYGTLLAAQGYTMKGSNAATATQNYTFVGKPNNGPITLPVAANNLNLCGNPYASAIDANAFITANSSSTTGTLYFWEHYASNTTHNTSEYQGGYATRTLVGGTPPVAPAGISGLGSSSKTPGRFIPVGSGFFVTGSATGGTITFNNAQRSFIKEDDASSNTLFKAVNPTVSVTNPAFNNAEDAFDEEAFTKVRVGFNSSDNHHKQILLGFMNEFATEGLDPGYDGDNIDFQPIDLYFIHNVYENHLNIQGVGFFNENNIYNMGVKNALEGDCSFVLDGKENLDENQNVYIFDNVTNQYHNIRTQPFVINLPGAEINSRFSLRFKDPSVLLGVNENTLNNAIAITHSPTTETLTIKNTSLEANVKSIVLFDILGQNLDTWNIENQNQATIVLPVTNLSAGTYIVKVVTDKGNVTKKILVK